jgi:hypothetical protein
MNRFLSALYRRRWLLLLTLGITLLFVFLRGYKLVDTLYFRNDIGRDFLELMDWQETGKPPLLGPLTSAVSFNQSAFYFYFFYPVFILTNHSYLSTSITLILMYVMAFWMGVYLLRNDRPTLRLLLATAFLLAIHPQVITQNRFVWNPSFVPLFTSIAFFAFIKLQQQFDWKKAWIFGLSLAFATGMSVSAVPAVVSFALLSLVIFKLKSLRLLITTTISHLFVFLPFLAFELKYNFQITARLLGRGQLKMFPEETTLSFKSPRLVQYLFEGLPDWRLGVGVLFVLCLVGCVWLMATKTKSWKEVTEKPMVMAFSLFLITSLLTLVIPVPMEAHYIFGPLTFLLIFIATLPNKIAAPAILVATLLWLQPTILMSHFQRAPRTIAETDSCMQTLCQQVKDPIFVSVQSSLHNHTGPEFRFLMKDNGCQVKYIEFEPNAAQLMAVIVDDSSYHHGQTAYDELTLFGTSDEISQLECSDKLEVRLLQRK